jgi:hypothetical protein
MTFWGRHCYCQHHPLLHSEASGLRFASQDEGGHSHGGLACFAGLTVWMLDGVELLVHPWFLELSQEHDD